MTDIECVFLGKQQNVITSLRPIVRESSTHKSLSFVHETTQSNKVDCSSFRLKCMEWLRCLDNYISNDFECVLFVQLLVECNESMISKKLISTNGRRVDVEFVCDFIRQIACLRCFFVWIAHKTDSIAFDLVVINVCCCDTSSR